MQLSKHSRESFRVVWGITQIGLVALILALWVQSAEGRVIVDVDGDGMSDIWARLYGSGGLDPAADADGDGFSNQLESIAGTDPFDPASKPAVDGITWLPEAAWIRWEGRRGVDYHVESSASLEGLWVRESTRTAERDGEMWHAFPAPPGGRGFFRVAVDEPKELAGLGDSDGDGQGDALEILTGADPYDAGSRFAVSEIGRGDVVRLDIRSVPGMGYQVQTYQGGGIGWVDEGSELVGGGEITTAFLPVGSERLLLRLAFGSMDTDGDGVSDWEESILGLDPERARSRGGELGDAEVAARLLAEPEWYEIRAVRSVAMPLPEQEGLIEIRRTSGLGRKRLHLELGGTALAGSDIEALPLSVEVPGDGAAVRIPVKALPGAAAGRIVTVELDDRSLEDPRRPAGAEVRVARPVTLSVKWFGAMGDGTTDDTAAIQTAIHFLEGDPFFNTLWFPAGSYRLATMSFSNETGTPTRRLLKLGSKDLAGRDLRLLGDPGAVLYSDASPTRAHMLVAMGSFRSLRIEGLTFEKSDTPLGPGAALGADGVSLVQLDERIVEDVTFDGCDFINCHGAVFTYGSGYDIRGHLRSLNFDGCRVLNPWGANTSGVAGVWGGGQQVAMGAWVGTASYQGCLFEGGGDDMSDAYRSPAGRLKDGCHFGSPMRLVFHDNEVRKMGVESVYQLNRASYMGTSAAAFIVPPDDGATGVTVPVRPDETTYLPGQLVSFRISTTGAQLGRNTILRVTGWDAEAQKVTVVNDGHEGNEPPGTRLPGLLIVYLQEPTAGEVDIRRNRVDGAFPFGAERTNPFGISSDVRGVIADNTILNCAGGVSTYREASVPLHPGATGLVIRGNRIVMRHPEDSPGPVTYGIQTHADEVLVVGNHIVCPLSRRSVGIALRGKNGRVLDNHISATEQVVNGYASNQRAVGILVGNTSFGTAIDGNTTRRFDVGVGPEPSQWIIHSVADHRSVEDVYPIDFRGLVDP